MTKKLVSYDSTASAGSRLPAAVKTEVQAVAPVASVNTLTGAVALTQDNVPDGTTNKAYTAAEKAKLAGVASSATANSTDAAIEAAAVATAGSASKSADTIVDGTTNKAFLATERTKLAAISGTNTGDQTSVTGNAGTATQLATARNVNGVPFDGSANITVARTGYGVAALGDSITANYGDQNQLREMEGPLSRACAEAGQNPLFRGTFATGGFTLQQIHDTWLPVVLALNPAPWACVILGGTNDAAISSGVGFSVTARIAILKSICDGLRGANIQPILATLTPRSDTSLVNQNVALYNRALWQFAIANGYDVVDYNKVVVNPATGGFLTGYAQSDNIHPDFKAVKIMGQELARVFDGMQKPSVAPTRATHSADPTNLLGAQGHFQVDTNADGIADGFSNAVARGATFSVVSDPDGVTKWQRITQPSSATGNNLLQKSISSVVTVGDTIEAICRVQTSGFDAALVAPTGLTGGTGPAWAFTVGFTGATHDLEPGYNWHTDLADGLVYLRGVVPASATGGITINLQAAGVPASGSVWMQFTEVCVRNLTTLGLV